MSLINICEIAGIIWYNEMQSVSFSLIILLRGRAELALYRISLAFLTLSFLIYLQSYFSFTGILTCVFPAFLIFVWCFVLEECSNVLEIEKIINTFKMYTFQCHVHLKNPCWYYIDKKDVSPPGLKVHMATH